MATILQQVVGFSLVGAGGALLDWRLFHHLTSRHRAWRRLCVSLMSTTCAMTWSFVANWLLVFQPNQAAAGTRLGRFLAVTCFSGWVLQSTVIRAVDGVFPATLGDPGANPRRRPFLKKMGGWVRQHGSKVAAIALGYVWNFCWYRAWVYAD